MLWSSDSDFMSYSFELMINNWLKITKKKKCVWSLVFIQTTNWSEDTALIVI